MHLLKDHGYNFLEDFQDAMIGERYMRDATLLYDHAGLVPVLFSSFPEVKNHVHSSLFGDKPVAKLQFVANGAVTNNHQFSLSRYHKSQPCPKSVSLGKGKPSHCVYPAGPTAPPIHPVAVPPPWGLTTVPPIVPLAGPKLPARWPPKSVCEDA